METQIKVIDLTNGWAEVGVEPRPFMKEVFGIDHTLEAWPYMKSVARPMYGAPDTTDVTWEITARIRRSNDATVYELQINDGAKIVNPRRRRKMEEGENSSTHIFKSREELETAYHAAVAAKKENG